MSAIAGIFFLDGRPVDRPVLERMLESIAHRGPDGEGTGFRELPALRNTSPFVVTALGIGWLTVPFDFHSSFPVAGS